MTEQALGPFEFHGVEFEPTKEGQEEAVGNCPLCFHESKRGRKGAFYVNRTNQRWHCKHCGEGGHLREFFAAFHNVHRKQTRKEHYEALAARRPPITPETLKRHRLVYNTITGQWLIPNTDTHGRITSLRIVTEPRLRILSTKGVKSELFNLANLRPGRPVYLMEGEWDCLAFSQLPHEGSVLSVPGNNVFATGWNEHFLNCDVYLCYDNEDGARKGMTRASRILQGTARSVHVIRWPHNTPVKYDVRDHINRCLRNEKDPESILSDFQFDRVESIALRPRIDHDDIEARLPKRRQNFNYIRKEFAKYYVFPEEVYDTLLMVLATIFAVQIPGDPLWVFLVGPSGCGKTAFINCLNRCHWGHYESSLNPTTLVSGWNINDEDPSLVPKLFTKCLLLKDFTEILALNPNVLEIILNIFRGAYDGRVERRFGNGVLRVYQGHFGVLAGVTDVIHGLQYAAVGERFIKWQMMEAISPGDNGYADEQILAAIRGARDQANNDEYLQRLIAQFLDITIPQDSIPELPEWFERRVLSLAKFVAHARSQVTWRGDQITHRPGPEMATRLSKQFSKTAQAISLVLGRRTIRRDIMHILEKAALNTAFGLQLEVLHHLYKEGSQDVGEIVDYLGIPPTTVRRKLEDLSTLRLVCRDSVPSASGLRKKVLYAIDPGMHALWDDAMGVRKHATRRSAKKKSTRRKSVH